MWIYIYVLKQLEYACNSNKNIGVFFVSFNNNSSMCGIKIDQNDLPMQTQSRFIYAHFGIFVLTVGGIIFRLSCFVRMSSLFLFGHKSLCHKFLKKRCTYGCGSHNRWEKGPNFLTSSNTPLFHDFYKQHRTIEILTQCLERLMLFPR